MWTTCVTVSVLPKQIIGKKKIRRITTTTENYIKKKNQYTGDTESLNVCG